MCGWWPRPGFQSYSAYTKVLAEKNRDHLLGPRAPQTVFFQVAAIDRRVPPIEDGASWPALLAHYRPGGFANDYLVLRRIDAGTTDADAAAPSPLGGGRVQLGDEVPVPASPGPVFVTINLRPTIGGRLINLLYKYNRLRFSVMLENGQKREFRFQPVMGRGGFVISPFIENAQDFAGLYTDAPSLRGLRAKSFAVSAEGGWSLQWRSGYDVTFSAVPVAGRQ